MSNQCHLLGGFFATGVQAGLGLLAVASLVVKRYFEHPKRAWKVWALDVSKQAIGGLFAHCLNLIAAEFLSSSSAFNDQVRTRELFNTTSLASVVVFVFFGFCLVIVVWIPISASRSI